MRSNTNLIHTPCRLICVLTQVSPLIKPYTQNRDILMDWYDTGIRLALDRRGGCSQTLTGASLPRRHLKPLSPSMRVKFYFSYPCLNHLWPGVAVD